MACECVRCGECNGSGQVMVRQRDYPEWDLEPCRECEGGISEVCFECQDAYERDLEMDQWAEAGNEKHE